MDLPPGHGKSGRPSVLVTLSGDSRVITARILLSRQTGDLIDALALVAVRPLDQALRLRGAGPKEMDPDSE
ncbi:hypothetical protein [Actinacidiphila glaucinigra]|uniref:hypothetical protein n=1 Tax=Actinacidiphila glaucinigra TaxID=235986 RepID=UPI0037246567